MISGGTCPRHPSIHISQRNYIAAIKGYSGRSYSKRTNRSQQNTQHKIVKNLGKDDETIMNCRFNSFQEFDSCKNKFIAQDYSDSIHNPKGKYI